MVFTMQAQNRKNGQEKETRPSGGKTTIGTGKSVNESEAVLPGQDPQGTMMIPQPVRTAFSGAYPDADVAGWRFVDNRYKVMFKDRNMQQVAVYDKNGNLLRRETELDAADVPGAIAQYYKKNYPNEATYHVWLVEEGKGKKSYTAPLNDKMLYFDADGQYIRTENRSPEDWDKDQPAANPAKK